MRDHQAIQLVPAQQRRGYQNQVAKVATDQGHLGISYVTSILIEPGHVWVPVPSLDNATDLKMGGRSQNLSFSQSGVWIFT